MHPLLRAAQDKHPNLIAFIRQLVECESPSDSPVSINRFVDLLIERTRGIAKAKRIKSAGAGDQLRLEFLLPGRAKEGQILALGHSDTVWPLGALLTMPFHERDGRLWGPGVLDMKAGLAFFIFAVRILRELDVPVKTRVTLLVVSDEETGSRHSRAITEAEAKKSDCVLVLEPGTGLQGRLKTARKGVGLYTVSVKGRASHAGVDFENGSSAIVEAAHQIVKIASLTNPRRGITVNPGVIAGGTRSNVIAAEARVDVDVRIKRMRDAEPLDRKFRALRPVNKQCSIQVDGGLNRPPMERTEAIASLFKLAQGVASQLGMNISESETGGGSDGNFTAALGIPTLDGLGAVGEGAHAPHESILVDRIADRVALLAGLIRQGRGFA